MSIFNLMERDSLAIENAENFIKPIEKLEYFVKNVPIQVFGFHRIQVFHNLSKKILKSITEHGWKAINLWKVFIDRLNSEYYGITEVHLLILSQCIENNHFKLALQIVQAPGLPQSISISQYQHYLILCSDVYNEFNRPHEALELLELATTLEDSNNFEMSFAALKRWVLTLRIAGKKIEKDTLSRLVQKIKIGSIQVLQLMMTTRPEQKAIIDYEYYLFHQISQNQELSPQNIQYLKDIGLYDLYRKGSNKKIAGLRVYISNQLKYPNQYRIKCTQITDIPVNIFQNIKQLNKPSSIYKYDSKQKTMYFEHRQATQDQLDHILNKTCVMQKIIKNRPAETKREDSEKSPERGFRGLTGLGGLGELGNMLGGMGGMGGFGGMFRGPMGKR